MNGRLYQKIAPFYYGVLYLVFKLYTFILDLPIFLTYPKLSMLHIRLWIFYSFSYSSAKHEREINALGVDPMELVDGLTPYSTFAKILSNIDVPDSTIFYDLGCGHGNLVFYMNIKYGVQSIGMELVPTYVKTAQRTRDTFNMTDVSFKTGDFLDADLSNGTLFFVAGTCFNTHTQTRLISLLSHIQPGSVVISTSYPIAHHEFVLLKKIRVPFSWGMGHLFLQKKEC